MAIVGGGPASETAFDTARIQGALSACPTGQAVELAASGTNVAFLIQPITVPSGVSLIVDGGVTVFASRNPTDYQTTSTELCGTYGPQGNGCNSLLNFTKNGSGSGVYGYGVIDARGGSTMLGGPNPGMTWWTNADNADGNGAQDNPIILKPTTNNFTLYKITLRNSPMFHVGWSGNGLTVWGIKIATPYTAHNTDGIDPTGTNVTITNSSISDGDDDIAVGASSVSANVTVSNVNTYSGHGLSVGSYTSAGLTNYLVLNANMAGTAADGNATGLRLKSAEDRGGVLNTITYENVCIRDTRYPLQLNPFYNTNTGTEIPVYENIVLQNVHVLAPTSTKYPYQVELDGHDINHLSSVTLDNVVFDQLVAANLTPAPEFITIGLEGNVYPQFLQTQTGTGVAYTGSATAIAGAGVSSCTNPFPYIVGELYLSTSTATSLRTASVSTTGSVTLNAMLEPAMSQTTYAGTSGTWTGVAAPANPVSFYEGSTLLGTGTLGANGTIATLTLSNLKAGTHSYTAQYPGDSNYAALPFGSVTVAVTGPTVATTTTLTAPSSGVYGTPSALSATVAGAGGTPSGSVSFYDGTTLLGAGTLASGTAALPAIAFSVGTHSLTAVYGGDSTFQTSTSPVSTLVEAAAASSTTLTANPGSVTVNGSSTLTATVTGVPGAAVPTGQVSFVDGTSSLGNATLNGSGVAALAGILTSVGAQTIKACYGGDLNYAGSCGSGVVTVTPISTSLSLALSATTVYSGGSVTLSATLSPAVPNQAITFLSGSTTLATATTNSAGTATYALVSGVVGSYSVSASAAASGNYAASTSTVQTLMVVNPLSLAATPNPIAITHGTSGTVTLSMMPAGGFTGAISLTCTTAVSYVTCSPSTSSATAIGTTAIQVTETISVAATTASMNSGPRGNFVFALLAPLGIFGLTLVGGRRRSLRSSSVLLLLLAVCGVAGIAGCGGGSSGGSSSTAPTGSQVVTIAAIAAGVSQTATVTVNIN